MTTPYCAETGAGSRSRHAELGFRDRFRSAGRRGREARSAAAHTGRRCRIQHRLLGRRFPSVTAGPAAPGAFGLDPLQRHHLLLRALVNGTSAPPGGAAASPGGAVPSIAPLLEARPIVLLRREPWSRITVGVLPGLLRFGLEGSPEAPLEARRLRHVPRQNLRLAREARHHPATAASVTSGSFRGLLRAGEPQSSVRTPRYQVFVRRKTVGFVSGAPTAFPLPGTPRLQRRRPRRHAR